MQHEMWNQLLTAVSASETKAIARSISLIENEAEGYEHFLASLPAGNHAMVIGITGPPGAGKSSLVDGMISELIKKERKIAVLCIDPSSPFHQGAVLGDRIRMSQWYNHPGVFIRSLASRGSLGGLHPKIIEITDLVQAAAFDYIILETVGVGQSEVEVAALADITVVVLVPEGGDDIQSMKSGLMEIADIFVVNKADRPGADLFFKNLQQSIHNAHKPVPVLKTIATTGVGIIELVDAVNRYDQEEKKDKRSRILADRAFYLIQKNRMKDIDRLSLLNDLQDQMKEGTFNLYSFVKRYE
jgi:LAO/AO transport system kinase